MDKYAAEKIASEYYELGSKVAQDKLASAFRRAFQKTLNAGIGGTAGIAANEAYGKQLRDLLGKNDYLKNVFAKGDASEALTRATKDIKLMDDRSISELYDVLGRGVITRDGAAKIIQDSKAVLGEGGMTTLEKVLDNAPGLALAGGVALPIYKGLGKLDRRLKFY
jgi:hypothetical protein